MTNNYVHLEIVYYLSSLEYVLRVISKTVQVKFFCNDVSTILWLSNVTKIYMIYYLTSWLLEFAYFK